MSSYQRPRPVKDAARAAARLLEARSALIELVLGPPPEGARAELGRVRMLEIDGALAVQITNAIETLEAAAENYGAVAADDSPAYVPVSAEELAEVRRALEERTAELETRRTPHHFEEAEDVGPARLCSACGLLRDASVHWAP